MSILLFTVLILVLSMLAGLIGALTGIGGGIIIIPALVLFFHIDIHYAMGASLITAMVTSSISSVTHLRNGLCNIRLGIYLEVAAIIGALIGASISIYTPTALLAILLSLLLFLSAYQILNQSGEDHLPVQSHPFAVKLKLASSYSSKNTKHLYHVQNSFLGFFLMGIAGIFSGVLGIGGGIFKVLAMDRVMRIPYKVSTTTSNFMIGLTTAASAGMFFTYGYILPDIIFPVVAGVVIGAYMGAKLLSFLTVYWLRRLFSFIVIVAGAQLLKNGLGGMI